MPSLPSSPLPPLPISDAPSVDVLVIGGGPAGSAAAIAASREGGRTLLLEASSALGGMATMGLVTSWAPFADAKGPAGQPLIGGIALRAMLACRAAMPHTSQTALDWVPNDPEFLKRYWEERVLSHGAELQFQTQVVAVERTPEGVVSAVIAASKAGLRRHRAQVVIDSTGDGDVCALAGAEFHVGTPGAREVMPATLCFIIGNVDLPALFQGPSMRSGDPQCVIFDILRSGRYPEIKDSHMCISVIGPGTVSFNAGHIWNVDSTDPRSVSAALVTGRKIAVAFQRALAEFNPNAFGRSFLVATAPLLGNRESRRIVGDYVLNLDDYVARRKFPDEIVRNNYWVDIHTTEHELESGVGRTTHDHVEKRFEHYGPKEYYSIPYRCLTPKGLRNVLVAGRCISTDKPMQGTTRVQPPSAGMGEAAGIAAAMVVRSGGTEVRRVDVAALRRRLRDHGALLTDDAALPAVPDVR